MYVYINANIKKKLCHVASRPMKQGSSQVADQHSDCELHLVCTNCYFNAFNFLLKELVVCLMIFTNYPLQRFNQTTKGRLMIQVKEHSLIRRIPHIVLDCACREKHLLIFSSSFCEILVYTKFPFLQVLKERRLSSYEMGTE